MNITTAPLFPATTRLQIVRDRLTESPNNLLAACPPPPTLLANHRGANGRFTKGCPPGPGRPSKSPSRHFVPPLQLLQRGLDMDDSSNSWNIIVSRFGPDAAGKLLENLEAEYGPICFRHLAIEAIAAAPQTTLTQNNSTKRTRRKTSIRSIAKSSPKRSLQRPMP